MAQERDGCEYVDMSDVGVEFNNTYYDDAVHVNGLVGHIQNATASQDTTQYFRIYDSNTGHVIGETTTTGTITIEDMESMIATLPEGSNHNNDYQVWTTLQGYNQFYKMTREWVKIELKHPWDMLEHELRAYLKGDKTLSKYNNAERTKIYEKCDEYKINLLEL